MKSANSPSRQTKISITPVVVGWLRCASFAAELAVALGLIWILWHGTEKVLLDVRIPFAVDIIVFLIWLLVNTFLLSWLIIRVNILKVTIIEAYLRTRAWIFLRKIGGE